MAAGRKSPDEVVQNRRTQIGIIAARLSKDGRIITVPAIRAELIKTKEFSEISESQVWHDYRYVCSENTFVKDMAQYTYSQMVENDYNGYVWIYDEARKNYEKKWTQSKQIRYQDNKSKGKWKTETVITEELAAPKARFLEIMIAAKKAMADIREGRSQKISVALLQHEFGQTKRELDILRAKATSQATS